MANAIDENEEKLKKFYTAIARSEERHYELFMNLAYQFGEKAWIMRRADTFLEFEADLIKTLPIRACLH